MNMIAAPLLLLLNTGLVEGHDLRAFELQIGEEQSGASERRRPWGLVKKAGNAVGNGLVTAANTVGNGVANGVPAGFEHIGDAAEYTYNKGVKPAAVGSWEVAKSAASNFLTCMAGTFKGDSCPKPPSLPDLKLCFLEFSPNVLDGFKAGCNIPEITVGANFGDANGDNNGRAEGTLRIGAASMTAMHPKVSAKWNSAGKGKLKEHLAVDAEVKFSFIEPVSLEFSMDNMTPKFEFSHPGIQMDFSAKATLYAEADTDPCSNSDECRFVLNKGNDVIISRVFQAGPMPVFVEIKAQVYVEFKPTIKGRAETVVEIGLRDDCEIERSYDYRAGWLAGAANMGIVGDVDSAETCANLCAKEPQCKSWTYGKKAGQWYTRTCFLKSQLKPNRIADDCCDSGLPCLPGVKLLDAVKLALHDPEGSVNNLKGAVNFGAVQNALRDQLEIEVYGGIEAEAELELCVGVELSNHINGLGATFKIPVCLTANADVKAWGGSKTGALVSAAVEVKSNEVKSTLTLETSDVSSIIDNACGLIGAVELPGMCVPVLDCAKGLVSDVCDGMAELGSKLTDQLKINDIEASITFLSEKELYSDSFIVEYNKGGSATARCRTRPTMCAFARVEQCNEHFPARWKNEWGRYDYQLIAETKGLCVLKNGRCTNKPTFCELANKEQCHNPRFIAVWGKFSTYATRMCEWA